MHWNTHDLIGIFHCWDWNLGVSILARALKRQPLTRHLLLLLRLHSYYYFDFTLVVHLCPSWASLDHRNRKVAENSTTSLDHLGPSWVGASSGRAHYHGRRRLTKRAGGEESQQKPVTFHFVICGLFLFVPSRSPARMLLAA